MFEKLTEGAERMAQARARFTAKALAERIAAKAPRDVTVTSNGESVQLSGRSLRRRFLLDPAFRWLIARSR